MLFEWIEEPDWLLPEAERASFDNALMAACSSDLEVDCDDARRTQRDQRNN